MPDEVPEEDLSMFGYVTVNRPEMKVKELELYRSYYCGLCHALHERYGRRGQLLLSYDGTFLAILLTGLYEPEERERRARCIIHPAVKHREKENRYIEYAADMNVMLAYRKALDDWQDESKQSARLTAMLLHRDYCRIRDRYPKQEQALVRSLRALRRLEAQGDGGESGSGSEEALSEAERMNRVLSRIDRAAGYTGSFFARMCVPHNDRWKKDLYRTGFYLGKFIYLMDAYDDLEKDEKSGCFNVLLQLRRLDPEHFEEILREILLNTAACCCHFFERLPIVQDVELLRNILYSGIWVRFYQIRAGEKDGKRHPVWCADA